MNCPHCGGDERACHRDDPCVGRMTSLVTTAIAVIKEIAQCPHHRTEETGAFAWCIACGAVRPRREGGWARPHLGNYAIELDSQWPTVDPPRIGEYNDAADKKRKAMKSSS